MKISFLHIRRCSGLFLLLVVSPSSLAYQVDFKSLEQMFHDAVLVSRFKITASKAVSVQENGKVYDCGIDYQATVISSFKGGHAPFTFRSTSTLATGSEYLAFFNTEYLDATVQYMSMGRNDAVGFELCAGSQSFYASGFHGEILEYDYLWKAATGEDTFRVTLNVPYLEKLGATKVEFKSSGVTDSYLDIMGFWHISWDQLEDELIALSSC